MTFCQQQRRQFLGRERLAEQEALKFGAELVFEIIELFSCFDTFRNTAKAEALGEI
jgi:hypothetical protein